MSVSTELHASELLQLLMDESVHGVTPRGGEHLPVVKFAMNFSEVLYTVISPSRFSTIERRGSTVMRFEWHHSSSFESLWVMPVKDSTK